MEDNKKGFNVLYLVLGVSTLVVAIIGATFAYFSARETNDTVITGNVAEAGGLVLSVTPVTESTGTNIIPLNLIVDYTDEDLTDEETGEVIYEDDGVTPKKKPKNVDQLASAMAATKKCVDDNGNNVCEVYRIEVTNTSATSTVQVRGTLNIAGTNTTNIYWSLLNADVTTGSKDVPRVDSEGNPVNGEDGSQIIDKVTTYTLNDGERFDYSQNVLQGNNGYLTVMGNTGGTGTEASNLRLTGSTAGDNSEVFYVIVWLEEIGTAQEDYDASQAGKQASYLGTVTFNAVDDLGRESGVTATFAS